MDGSRRGRIHPVLPALLAGLVVGAALGAGGAAALRGRRATLDLSVRDGGLYRVARVVDGDTIVLEQGLHVRYAGIDAPEIFDFRKDPEPFAEKATEANCNLVEGREVVLRLGARKIDPHGRLCARVCLPGEEPGEPLDVSAEIVRQGLAYVRYGGDGATAALRAAEDEAHAAARGLWAPGSPANPPSSAAVFVASRTGRAFHRPGCHHARSIKLANRLEFATREEARAAGLAPCKACEP